jgi:uncharacterized protein (DUF2235 family)
MNIKHNIAVFFDGTWNTVEKPSKFTNVKKLKDAIVGSYKGDNDIPHTETCTYYEEGPGTRPNTSIFGGGFAHEMDHLIYEAYDWLIRKYDFAAEKGISPEIYLFGFSRGAYMAHIFSWLLQIGGIPKDISITSVIANAFFKKEFDHIIQMRNNKQWKCYDPVIRMLGLWDMVSAPLDICKGYYDGEPAPIVKGIYHAMALDEKRSNFPVLKYRKSENVTQRWFRGAHSDIGGGYEDDSTLSDITLAWMAQKATNEGMTFLPLVEAQKAIIEHDEGGIRPRIFEGEEIDDSVIEFIGKGYIPTVKDFIL